MNIRTILRSAATALAVSAALLVVPGAVVRCAAQPPVASSGLHYDAAAPLDAKIAPGFDPKSPPEGILNYSVTFRGGGDAVVPGLYITPPASVLKLGKVPCVLLVHGLGGKKEQVAPIAMLLATHGFASLSIDVAGHGERPKVDGKALANLDTYGMHTLVAQTVVDLRRAVDFVQTRPEIDGDRVGYLGVSLGGIIGGVFAGQDARVKAVVLWAAGGDWGKLASLSDHPFAKQFRTNGAVDAAAVESVMADVDPLNTIAAISPRPLLMINGDKDTTVPVVCTDELANAAKEPKERITLPGAHIPNAMTMTIDSLNWLNAHLKK